MSVFFPGQRVRVIYRPSSHFGKECRVTRVDVRGQYMNFTTSYVGVEVDIPCNVIPGLCVFERHELEPITPPHQAGSWEEVENLMPKIRNGELA